MTQRKARAKRASKHPFAEPHKKKANPADSAADPAAPPPPKGQGHPPIIELDPKKIKTLASYGCTQEEIAAVMNCSVDTLARRYAEAMREGRNARNGGLRMKQFRLADTSAAMAIFLGKQYLGQSDKHIVDRPEDGIRGLTDDDLDKRIEAAERDEASSAERAAAPQSIN
jgi:hypothetical protein